MTAPRFIRPGRTWLITRRTTRRTFLLRPDSDGTSQTIYWYTTAVLAAKFGIKVHAVQVLSTHMHEVLTDVHGNLPAFLRERNRALANALKRHRDWPEEVFQRAATSCVEIYGVQALLREIAYTLANCVEAGLTKRPRDWPGVRTLIGDMGHRTVRVSRPPLYFREREEIWPEHAELRIEMPPLLVSTFGRHAWKELAHVARSAVRHARKSVVAAGKFFEAAASTLMRAPFTRTAKKREQQGGRNPTFATAGDPSLTKLAVEERTSFYRDYSYAKRNIGNHEIRVAFPFGAWRWVRELGHPSMPAPPGLRPT